jgi:hypothetical protein
MTQVVDPRERASTHEGVDRGELLQGGERHRREDDRGKPRQPQNGRDVTVSHLPHPVCPYEVECLREPQQPLAVHLSEPERLLVREEVVLAVSLRTDVGSIRVQDAVDVDEKQWLAWVHERPSYPGTLGLHRPR